jgi:membrane carboxypeptidase/penicillin-binding protein
MSGIQVDREALVAKSNEIAELDQILDAQSGSKAAGKRSVVNKLVANSASTDFVNQVIAKIRENFTDEELYATFYSLVNSLTDDVGDEAEQYVDSEVEKNQAQAQEKLPEDQIAEISEDRKKKVQEFKALKSILEMFGTDVSDVPEPKSRRGSRGPRGPRTLSKFQYQVNDTVLDEEVNSLATVAKLAGSVKVAELKAFITEQGVDLKNPPVEWTAQLPNNTGTLTATALPEFADDFVEDDEDETDAA